MIEQAQGVGRTVSSRAGQQAVTSSVTGQGFGVMLQEQLTRRGRIRQEAAQSVQTLPQSAAPTVTQSDVAQIMRQAVTQATQADARQGMISQADARRTVNFSKHALARAEERGIELTPDLMGKLADSVERAQEKGAKNILAFNNSQAFIINIPYGRVITTMSGEEMRENIFTNIDGAVLL